MEKVFLRIHRLKLLRDKLYVTQQRVGNFFRKSSGINTIPRKTKLLVSLTSYPERFDRVSITIESLLNQTLKPDKIILWLAKEEVDQTALPTSLTKLTGRGLDIKIVNENIKSYKKLIYSIEQFSDHNIVTCDDDWFYTPWFLEKLYKCHKKYPDCISAYRCRMMSKVNQQQITAYTQWPFAREQGPSHQLFPTTGGGVLFPPGSLNEKVSDRIFLQLSPYADDIWFKAMSLLNKTMVVMVQKKSKDFYQTQNSKKSSLYKINIAKNDEQLKNVFDYFQLYNAIT